MFNLLCAGYDGVETGLTKEAGVNGFRQGLGRDENPTLGRDASRIRVRLRALWPPSKINIGTESLVETLGVALIQRASRPKW